MIGLHFPHLWRFYLHLSHLKNGLLSHHSQNHGMRYILPFHLMLKLNDQINIINNELIDNELNNIKNKLLNWFLLNHPNIYTAFIEYRRNNKNN